MRTAVVNERAPEYGFVFDFLKEYHPERVLDVGTGTTALPALLSVFIPEVVASDNVTDYWPNGMTNKHCDVVDNDIVNSTLEGEFDLITCISVLEHIEKDLDAIDNMIKLLAPGGKLIITCPYRHTEYVPNAYDITGVQRPYICKMYDKYNVDDWCSRGLMLDKVEYWRIFAGDYWGQGIRIKPLMSHNPDTHHHLACLQFTKMVL